MNKKIVLAIAEEMAEAVDFGFMPKSRLEEILQTFAVDERLENLSDDERAEVERLVVLFTTD